MKLDEFLAQQSGVSVSELDSFLAHHGVKGMHWGIRRPRTPAERMAHIDKKIARTHARIKEHKATISELQSRQRDAHANGVNSGSFKKEFGNHSTNVGFALQYGRTKSQALSDHKADLQYELDNAQHALGFHQNRLQRQQARKAKLASSR